MHRRGRLLVAVAACVVAVGAAAPATARSPQRTLALAVAKLRRLHVHPAPLLFRRAPRSFANAEVLAYRGPHSTYTVFFLCCGQEPIRRLNVGTSRLTAANVQDQIQNSQRQGYQPTPQRVRRHAGLYVQTNEGLGLIWHERSGWYSVGAHVGSHNSSRRALLALANGLHRI